MGMAALVADLRRRVAALERMEKPAGIDPAGHDHAKLVASDGSPDPALSMDASGHLAQNVTQAAGLYIATDEIRVAKGAAATPSLMCRTYITTGLYWTDDGIGPSLHVAISGVNALTINRLRNVIAAETVSADAFIVPTNIANPTDPTVTFYNQAGIGATVSGTHFEVRTGATPAQRVFVSGTTGAVRIVNLAGAGNRAVIADANGVLSAP